MNVGELKKVLENIPDEHKVRVSVIYDRCEHMQPLRNVFDDVDWSVVVLIGGWYK